ncbi:uncharacterized protein LOC129573785 [Sitodiplosis mosellana]|uniref:uncharacterized protein LOC129573785 n=1 Tax=Sitodiplosis mosellana TaxID=263140 RepID=UPI00244454FA|nr:uncharacterized protein LOC129573785 [Sitodiplosis mosellana]XP_055310825.1 uncharacterized protein LOC129573785 [Sitodiplosis mosellana]
MSDLAFIWKRPNTIAFPKVWHTFQARDLDSDELIEYRIQDLPLDRFDEALEHMNANYNQDEPIAQVLDGGKQTEHLEDYKLAWRPMAEQKVPLVCFKEGSDEIVGINMLFVINKDDHFMEKIYGHFKSQVTKDIFDLMMILYENFDPFQHYGVDEYLSSFGLSVSRKYRGRSIGDHFLATRKNLCNEFALKLTHTFFTSDFSNHNADKAGFETNVAIKYEDVIKTHPRFNHIKNIKSKAMTLKTMVC